MLFIVWQPHITGEASMSHPQHTPSTVIDEVPREIVDLAEIVRCLPAEHQARLEPALARVIENTKRRRRILGLVQDALGQLRLDMKYLTFDLEATRRERDDYRRKLDETA
jgi:hypothetical protein